MQAKKVLVVAGAVTSVGLASIAGLGAASAATASSSDSSSGGVSGLVSKLAEKFNVNESDVQAVFDEDRSQHEAEMQAKTEEKLAQAVTDGKLTSAQKDALIAKQAELQAARESDRDNMQHMTDDQRKAAMDAKRDELQAWADENNIPDEYLRYVMGGGHRGPGGPGGAGGHDGMPPIERPTNTDAAADSQ